MQKCTIGAKIRQRSRKALRLYSFFSPGDITSGKSFTLESISEAFWRDRVSRAGKRREKDGFSARDFQLEAKMSGRIIFKTKKQAPTKRKSAAGRCERDEKSCIRWRSNFMKNAPRDLEIEPEDFDSIFLWKVFWKLLRQENSLCFFLKILLLGAAFVALILFIFLVGDLTGA